MNSRVLEYLLTGRKVPASTSVATIRADLCPWHYFQAMNERDKHATALFYGR